LRRFAPYPDAAVTTEVSVDGFAAFCLPMVVLRRTGRDAEGIRADNDVGAEGAAGGFSTRKAMAETLGRVSNRNCGWYIARNIP